MVYCQSNIASYLSLFRYSHIFRLLTTIIIIVTVLSVATSK